MTRLENLSAGDHIMVVNADGDTIPKRALGPMTPGGSFDVVWACREEEWQAALIEQRDPEGMPWPASDVRTVDDAATAR